MSLPPWNLQRLSKQVSAISRKRVYEIYQLFPSKENVEFSGRPTETPQSTANATSSTGLHHAPQGKAKSKRAAGQMWKPTEEGTSGDRTLSAGYASLVTNVARGLMETNSVPDFFIPKLISMRTLPCFDVFEPIDPLAAKNFFLFISSVDQELTDALNLD